MTSTIAGSAIGRMFLIPAVGNYANQGKAWKKLLTCSLKKWPDKSTTSYAMLDFQNWYRKFVREMYANQTLNIACLGFTIYTRYFL